VITVSIVKAFMSGALTDIQGIWIFKCGKNGERFEIAIAERSFCELAICSIIQYVIDF
jgi:hypothetical protein